jgi:magnesium chelatase accessory protein
MTRLSLAWSAPTASRVARGAAPSWEQDGRDWPNRAASRFVRAGGMRWHVQVLGAGPAVLLVHGTGAATHSWRDLAPMLAERFTVIAPDLPGHGFSDCPPAHLLSLPAMAQGLASLLGALGQQPLLVAGHSAGAAILARMCLDQMIAPFALVSLNGALLPLTGLPGHVFAPAARFLAALPGVPRLFARRALDRSLVERLLRDTGSVIDARGTDLYASLVSRPGHVAATLGMMAKWDLRPLERDLPLLATRLVLVAGGNDRTIPPDDARRIRALVPGAVLHVLPGLGHLAHEERPADVAALIGALA